MNNTAQNTIQTFVKKQLLKQMYYIIKIINKYTGKQYAPKDFWSVYGSLLFGEKQCWKRQKKQKHPVFEDFFH